MKAAQLGISREYLPIPGETIDDIRKDRQLTQKDLATKVGLKEPYLNKVIRGQKPISNKLAQGLEYALGIDKTFWLNLQAEYEAALLKLNEADSIDEEERSIQKSLKKAKVGSFLLKKGKIPSDEELVDNAVLTYRRGLGISRLSNLPEIIPAGAFRVAHGKKDPCVMGAWLLLAMQATEGQQPETEFSKNLLPRLIGDLKAILNSDEGHVEQRIRAVFLRYGINFSVIPHFKGAPVQGYIARDAQSHYRMVLTIRGAWADRFWFTLFHELGHIVNGDLNTQGKFLDDQETSESKSEIAANEFARRTLINDEAYEAFIKTHDPVFTDVAIEKFAKTQGVPMWIAKGRLQNDKYVAQNNRSGMVTYGWADK